MRYIATRPRVAKNEGMDHGLFGKLETGPVMEFQDWKEVARLVYQNSKKHITMYRSVVSFDEETAAELRLTDQKAWQRYIENHILTIAEKNKIKREHLQWACALHREKNHPHIHVVFWDTSDAVRNPFTPPAVPNAIRKQMIRDTFTDKIRALGADKTQAAADMRQISMELVEQFERHIRQMEKRKYQKLQQAENLEAALSDAFDFDDVVLEETAERVLRLRAALPDKGRVAYQLLPPDCKAQVDELVKYLLEHTPALQKCKDSYVQSKLRMPLLYGGSDDYIKSMQDRFSAEADKIIANRVLGMVKTLNRLDSEYRSADYLHSRRLFYVEQMLMEALDMLSALTDSSDRRFEDEYWKHGDLSKEARKELYLKFQDKGYEH